jgi:hypothetical protein
MTDEATLATGCESRDAPDVDMHDDWRLKAPVEPATDGAPDEQDDKQDDTADTLLQPEPAFRACRQSF